MPDEHAVPFIAVAGHEGNQETVQEDNMEYVELFTLIIGFMTLAVIMNRSTMSLRDHNDRTRREADQRLEQFRTEIGKHLESIRQEMIIMTSWS